MGMYEMVEPSEKRHLVQTSIDVYADQLDDLEASDANLGGLVRDLLDELEAHDELTAEELEGLLSEVQLLRNRCDRLEELLQDEEAVENADVDSGRTGAGRF